MFLLSLNGRPISNPSFKLCICQMFSQVEEALVNKGYVSHPSFDGDFEKFSHN